MVKHNIIVLQMAILFANLMFSYNAQRTGPGKSNVTFEEVTAKASGITWVHNNAHSPERYLPETVGAGCAFFDYDNDGWMDIYLVNSGPSDFYTPTAPSRTRFIITITTEPLTMLQTKPECPAEASAWEWPVRITMAMVGRTFISRATVVIFSIAIMATEHSAM